MTFASYNLCSKVLILDPLFLGISEGQEKETYERPICIKFCVPKLIQRFTLLVQDYGRRIIGGKLRRLHQSLLGQEPTWSPVVARTLEIFLSVSNMSVLSRIFSLKNAGYHQFLQLASGLVHARIWHTLYHKYRVCCLLEFLRGTIFLCHGIF